MNKELKETKRLRKLIKEMNRKNYSITYDYNCDFLQDLETVLNYIDNSIPKEVIEKKIEYYKNLIEECKNDEEHYGEIYLYKIYIDALQELLEGK